ncbi:hypothetical protein HON52_00450 [Candidatus Uhrbacteria bacterium]|jgi:hypothetical protein|nr:hypothetical protein [Candidatus Uhrbacteria bacterium]
MTNILKRVGAVALALALAFPLLYAAVPVSAATLADNLEEAGDNSTLATSDLPETIGILVSVLVSVLGIVLLMLVIYAGFLWMTAGGNTDQVGKAKTIMINSVVGLIILLAAYSITNFVITALSDANLVS